MRYPFLSSVVFSSVLLAFNVPIVSLGQEVFLVAQESAPGAGDFRDNILGTVAPYVTAGTAAAYYNWSLANPHFAGPAPTLVSDAAHLDTTDHLIELDVELINC